MANKFCKYEQHREDTCKDKDGQTIAPYQFLAKRFIRNLTVHHIQGQIIPTKGFSAPERTIKYGYLFVKLISSSSALSSRLRLIEPLNYF